ncbi:2OG-Fe dioxygenase family protein [Salinithrix halophila]|uniref:2OG-Fe dioxygenase family protein n=1 Tax=Salinithrix halophila TaxID=1485204 RepID=A0ABV8JJ29_9BACL
MNNFSKVENEKGLNIDDLCKRVMRNDYHFIPSSVFKDFLHREYAYDTDDFINFKNSWDNLKRDDYMADGGSYRFRRHATLSALPSGKTFHEEPHQPHYQSISYNNLNGGIARHYEPVETQVMQGKTMTSILSFCCNIFGRLYPYAHWHIEVHQFRIVADKAKEGKPTPEGIHNDGVSFVMMMMVNRENITNGNTTIYDNEKQHLDEFTLTDSFDAAIVNDDHVMHGVTPIVPLDPDQPAFRDVLVVTFRKK